jgi:thymidylate synthase (FAD)
MELVTPYARILPPPYLELDNSPVSKMREFDGVELLRRIEYCARISHRSEDMPADTDRFLRAVVLKHGDWSVVEHASITVEFLVDRGVTHELVRHRIFSITQESTRFVNYLKRVSARFIIPPFQDENLSGASGIWHNTINACLEGYTQLIKLGYSPQIARSVLPNALSSKIVITGNLRQWRHFFIMRTTKETHPQMREVTVPLLDEIKKVIPIIFEDIEPGALQRDNLKLPR